MVVIAAENLVKRFGDLVAVADISFEVQAGEILRHSGPRRRKNHHHQNADDSANARPAARVEIDGFDPVTNHARGPRSSFGIVFQDPSLDDELTAYENMDLHGALYNVPRANGRERIETLLNFVRTVGPAQRPRQDIFPAA